MRALIPLLFLALPANAETLSQEIATKGIAPTLSRLQALPSPTPEEAFARSGLHFLRAVEISFQLRQDTGLSDSTGLMPLLQLPLPPKTELRDPAALARLFQSAQAELDQVVPVSGDFALTIALDDLWFDLDANLARDPGEGFADLVAPFTGMAPGPLPPGSLPLVTFDTADADWLAAYGQLLSGLCDLALAFDPTEAMTKALEARAQMKEIGALASDTALLQAGGDPFDFVDILAVLIEALRQEPDAARTASAKAHLMQMVALNRSFWTKVAAETDNMGEWIPNDGQTSALGLTIPPGAGPQWLAVLDELEALLTGRKLLPWWRSPGVGIDLGAFLDRPAPLDIPGWAQGWSALPYLKQGEIISTEALEAFDSLVQGQAPVFALYFN